MELFELAMYKAMNGSGGGGDSGLFETVNLKINLPDGFGYDLIAPVLLTEEGINYLSAISESINEPIATYDIVIPTNSTTIIQIKPMWGSGEVVIVSGGITAIDSTLFALTGNAEVTVQRNDEGK